MAPESNWRVPSSPQACTKPMDPKLQRATIVSLYLGNMIIPLLKVLLSSSNINYAEYAKLNKQTNSNTVV